MAIIVLVIDEDPSSRRALKVMLAGDTFVVLTASSGPEGIGLVRRYAPALDIVFLSYEMKDGDGLITARRILDIHPLPVIFIMPSRPLPFAAIFESYGYDSIQKPFNREELTRKIGQVLSRQVVQKILA